MRISRDTETNAGYIQIVDEIGEGEAVTQEKVSDDIILDFNEMGQLLGIEFLDAETTMPPDSRLTGITPNNFRDMIKYIRSED